MTRCFPQADGDTKSFHIEVKCVSAWGTVFVHGNDAAVFTDRSRVTYAALVDSREFLEAAGRVVEVVGISALVVGMGLGLLLALADLIRGRGGAAAFRRARTVLGGAILLGLEILVAADLIKTVTAELSLGSVLALGIVVLIRTVLSFTIEIEMDGVLPWRKALTRSGASLVAEGVRGPGAPTPAP